jgi:hypothetical protein
MNSRVLGLVLIWLALQSLPVAGGEQSHPTTGTAREEALRILAEEDAELDYLYRDGEVPAEEYQLTKARHWVLRRYLLGLPEGTVDLPEIHVVSKGELGNLFRRPPDLTRLRVGDTWDEHWSYRGKMVRGRTFYIFERR